jgi:hypothetical protein
MENEKNSAELLEALRFENELLKVKIMAQFGPTHIYFNKDFPPDVENEFLKSILAVEEDEAQFEEIPIYDFIGRPDFIKETDLSDEELEIELDRVSDLLSDKNIIYDSIFEVDDRDMYKFLTEDLFQHPIINNFVEGWGSHYYYETFHPNHENDTGELCEDFIDAFFANDFHEKINEFPTYVIRNYDDLMEFHDLFCGFRNVGTELISCEGVVPDHCFRKVKVSFDAYTSPDTKPIFYTGEAAFELEYSDETWIIVSVMLPGMM